MDFIDRLREKPPKIKKRIAIATSAVMTLIIFGVWASVFHFGFEQKPADVTATVANGSDTDVNPFSALINVISIGWDGLAKNIDQVKTGVNNAKGFVGSFGTTTNANYATSPKNDVIMLSGSSTDKVQVTQ